MLFVYWLLLHLPSHTCRYDRFLTYSCKLAPSLAFLSLAAHGRSLMQASVADSTAAHYNVGWRAWVSFAKVVDQSPFPSSSIVLRFDSFALPVAIAMATGFCAYGRDTLHLTPSTICGYLSGVAFHLKMANHDASFLASPPVQMARAGLRRLAAKDNTPSKSRLPFTLDLIRNSLLRGFRSFPVLV